MVYKNFKRKDTENSKNKDDRLVIRIDSELKERFIKYVESKGATVSDYVRQMIVEEMSTEEKRGDVLTVGEFLTQYYSSNLEVSNELKDLKRKMIKLEEKLNENKE